MLDVYRAVVPAIALLMVCLAAITYIPSLTLALPRAMGMVSEAAAAPGTEGAVESDSDELLRELELDGLDDALPEDEAAPAGLQDAAPEQDEEAPGESAEDAAAREQAERRELEKLLESDSPAGAGDDDELQKLLDE